MVTGKDSTDLAMTAIELGAYGYLVKPVGSGELLINVANALHRRSCEARNRHVTQRLRVAVQQRSEELARALQELELAENKVWVSQAETIFRLARLMEFRDEETGQHLHRMSSYCGLLARQTGLSEQSCASSCASPASCTTSPPARRVPGQHPAQARRAHAEEFEVIKGHAETGLRDGSRGPTSEIVQLGALIARTHHERLGRGRLSHVGSPARTIPLEGRIAAVADVFDALTSDRVLSLRAAGPVRDRETMR